MSPHFSCVCAGTVYVMTVADNGWGESYISYTECKDLKSELFTQLVWNYIALLFGSRLKS